MFGISCPVLIVPTARTTSTVSVLLIGMPGLSTELILTAGENIYARLPTLAFDQFWPCVRVTAVIFDALQHLAPQDRILIGYRDWWTCEASLMTAVCAVFDFRYHWGVSSTDVEVNLLWDEDQIPVFWDIVRERKKYYIGRDAKGVYWVDFPSSRIARVFARLEEHGTVSWFCRWCTSKHVIKVGRSGRGRQATEHLGQEVRTEVLAAWKECMVPIYVAGLTV